MVISFLYHRYGSMQANGAINRKEWMSVKNDAMSKVISLHSMYPYVLFS